MGGMAPGGGGGQGQPGQSPGAWRAQDFQGGAPTLNGMTMRDNYAESHPHASSNPYQAMAAAGMYADPRTAQQNATPDQMGQWRNWVDQSQAFNDSPGQVQGRLAAARAAGNNPILSPGGQSSAPQAAPGLSMTPQQMHQHPGFSQAPASSPSGGTMSGTMPAPMPSQTAPPATAPPVGMSDSLTPPKPPVTPPAQTTMPGQMTVHNPTGTGSQQASEKAAVLRPNPGNYPKKKQGGMTPDPQNIPGGTM